ncbi:type VI secretion system membrane subunit TssM [Variovorax arabinosiphilus]|uniref:type VI secretion system membrane subunit TssM n=1 Tax=Variovorax arabinosiphilus TaxID=3053498 RepID=UPI00257803C5|nr:MULTISPECIES: type VI secretion system membrane subunit TssM [unclassified Variovorax]MDM0120861.1 type VI secretion system membrane subunit TssM [Variovorax sp. J2L1-78]MDM0127227.1 type VI secretion system membrane subunit TssM [Variovorax sp. J2L1-63]MDM0236241.1 type VI secretion system membrane subunit TssM [Variovorax sp. J2R1-6]
MQYLKSFLSFFFSRQMLAFLAVLLLALAVWFIGPLLAVNGLRPLASVGVRIALVVLLLAFAIVLLASWSFSVVGVPAVCLLIWHAGPLLSLGDARPLAPVSVRVAVIAAILVIYAIYGLYLLWQALQADEKLVTKILSFGKRNEKADEAQAELKTVAATVQRAMSQLRSLRGRGGVWRRIFEGKRYLYELPWYMIVGSAGAGKTTALLNSGLQFPAMRQMGNASKRMVLQSQGGTLHCDWWFSNEAVLIDTAGRYTTQEIAPQKDLAEWRGFLGLLRKQRTRAPINGVIVALNAAELLTPFDIERSAQAEQIRDRLAELRQELGIRFPVYVIVTKMDLLKGFKEYFQALTSEGRTQAWGFTLPYETAKGAKAADIAGNRQALREQVGEELTLLKDRLAAGLRSRLSEEFDVDRRRRLFALPQELAGLSVPLAQMIDEIFLDSRFDSTQLHHTLRGVYFTSGAQADAEMAANPDTLLERLRGSLSSLRNERSGGQEAGERGRADTKIPTAHQGFFLQDVLTKVIVPEAHLVRPNLGWEVRFRVLRLLGHALAVVIFLWLAGALALSFGNNRRYLDTVGARAQVLTEQVRGLFANFKPTGVPDVLNAARELPGYAGLDVDNPPASYLYGLYTVPPVLDAAAETYAQLQDHMLLPPILQRMEAVLATSVKDGDAKTAYETLRVYKLLHDKARYMQDGGARDVRNWVLKDWERADSAAVFGGRASMVGHVERLFSGARPVQAASLPNEALVREVQSFLNGNTSTQRVYERAKTAMATDAPQEFTLVRAVGPQVGTVFSRQGGLPLEKGVPGLFTYDGYHDLFNKRLPEFVAHALEDDAWVMGRGAVTPAFALDPKKTLDDVARLQDNPLLDDIRRQYLGEYAQHWERFLESIRTVGGGDTTGTSLGFDLSVLRQFAAPDSPLARLARAAARETTLSRPLASRAPEDKSFFDKATDELNKQTRDIGKTLGIRREERLEKQLVDDRFAALREVVTGQPDMALTSGAGALTAKPGLEAISGLVNEFYTLLVVADTALTAGSLPPGGAEVGARLKMEAGKLPAPFREVLTALATSGGDKVVQGSQDILRKQAQLQLDRIMGLMAMQVSEPCKRGVEGRYPLAAVTQDASVEDFTQVFAVGGAADEFFTKYLLPFVDTSVRPWRYKNPDTASAMVGAENIAAGTPPAPVATGPTLLGELLKLLAQSGPNLEAFYRAQQIRDLFFRDAGGRKLAWKMDMKVLDLDPTITDLVMDIDGQGQRYIHGPVQSFTVNWPGPRGGSMAELVANPRISGATSTVSTSGPWALFRLLDKGRIVVGATPGRASVEFSFDGRKALLDLSAGSQPNPLNSDLLKGFRCPGRAA